ncbi:unnamed protein product, partial [marine sediment metagenome]
MDGVESVEKDHGCGGGDAGEFEVFGCLFEEAACFSSCGSFYRGFAEAGFAAWELGFGKVDGGRGFDFGGGWDWWCGWTGR